MGDVNIAMRLELRRPSTGSEEHTSELKSPCNLLCRLLLEKKKRRSDVVTGSAKIAPPGSCPAALTSIRARGSEIRAPRDVHRNVQCLAQAGHHIAAGQAASPGGPVVDKEKHPCVAASRDFAAHGLVGIPRLDVAAGPQAESLQRRQGPVKKIAGAVG